MTATQANERSARTAGQVVTEFFDRYRAHDVNGMTDLCSINADFSYVPVEMWGKQRVLRGDGKVGTIGKPLWTGLITAFPDLTNTVHTVAANDGGDEIPAAEFLKVEVVMGRGAPEPQAVDGLAAEANDGPVEGNADQGRGTTR